MPEAGPVPASGVFRFREINPGADVVRSGAMTLAAVFPPMITPFTGGEVDERAIGWNVERWMRAGLGGVVALGTNGEAALLGEDEADRVLEAVRGAVPSDRLLIAGTGRESTRATIAATRRAS